MLLATAVTAATGIFPLVIYLAETVSGETYTNRFTLAVFAVHLLVGPPLIALFAAFSVQLVRRGRRKANSSKSGCAALYLASGATVAVSGLLLCQFDGLPRLATGTTERSTIYVLHVIAPFFAAAYFLLQRPNHRFRWRCAGAWSAATVVLLLTAGAWQIHHPQRWLVAGADAGAQLFEPSKTRTVDGEWIPAAAFLDDQYCRRCHEDTYQDWFHSVHHFSSFNNPVYRFSVVETREVLLKRDGNVTASRWCAGCHDPLPLLSGAFDDPNYVDVNDAAAHAGITCTVCHAIIHVNSTIGNGDYTIEPPQHYPWALSDNSILRWISDHLLKARPDFHKKSLLKPFHREPEFCSTCHKVSLPMALNHYKEFLRGQNHFDTFLLSGASGRGARGFYYPAQGKQCNACHMPLKPSIDLGSRHFDRSGITKIHNHLTLGANTGVLWLASLEAGESQKAEGLRRTVRADADFLRGTDPAGIGPALCIDIFGLKSGGTIDGRIEAPLRPRLPAIVPGETYLVEVVIRTLNVGHPFTQGTADSNEVWVEFVARSENRVLGSSGGLEGPNDTGRVDPWAHFVNAFLVDREGRRINRHNPQDILAAVYDHQIPPGAAQVVHYQLRVPQGVAGPIELEARLRYRKISQEYADYVAVAEHPGFRALLRQSPNVHDVLWPSPGDVADKLTAPIRSTMPLPIVDLCEDRIGLPVVGQAGASRPQVFVNKPTWQRWNDYGIGCYLEGGPGSKRGEFRQAEAAFHELLQLDDKEAHAHAYLNLARVYFDEGRLTEAADALNKARTNDPPAPWWTVAWLAGMVNAETGHLDDAIACFEQILEPRNQPRERNFDFTRDYVISNELARTLFRRSQQASERDERDGYLRRAVRWYETTLRGDCEDLDAHYGLAQCFARLGDAKTLPAAGATAEHSDDEAWLKSTAKQLADPRLARQERLFAASRLAGGIERLGNRRPDPARPKLRLLQDLTTICRPVFGSVLAGVTQPRASDEVLSRAAAHLLGLIYRQTHEVLKPDDNARDRAVRICRQRDPAVNHAAQPIVIYPLHRPGAPGLDRLSVKVSAGELHP
jgi:tetratricopeptide (TPR) repeat protein